jgi:hypothetical protein
VEVDYAIERIVAILKLNPLLDRAEVIAKVEGIARWLNS